MKKIFIGIILLVLFIGCVNASDVNLDYSNVENEITEDSSIYSNENIKYDSIDKKSYNWCDDLNESVSDDDLNSLDLNTTDVIMSDNEYSCGASSFATVLNKMGINISLNESKIATKTTNNGTTMDNIINAAKSYNLTAYAINTDAYNLKENFIVHMDIIGINHWSVVREINNETIILADPNLGNYKYDLNEFKQYYTNQTILIINSKKNNLSNIILPKNTTFISEIGQKIVSGKGYAYYVSRCKDYIPVNPKGYVLRYTIIVPKWGGKTVKLQTTKLTKHRISTKVIYTIKVFSKSNYKGKVETIYQPAFFNFASKAGTCYSVTRKSSFGIKSIKGTVTISPFPYS